jgi:hypothetical protein
MCGIGVARGVKPLTPWQMPLNMSLKLDNAAVSLAQAFGTQLLMAELSSSPEHMQFRAVGLGVGEKGAAGPALGGSPAGLGVGLDLTGVTLISRSMAVILNAAAQYAPVKQPALSIG